MKKKTKILFAIDSLDFGGAERQLVELIKGLHKTNCYEIHLICLSESENGYGDIISQLGIPMKYFVRSYRYDLLGPLYALIRYVLKYDIDIIHTFMKVGSFFGALAAKFTGRKVVCSTIRDAMDSSLKEKYLVRFLEPISDFFVANSQAGFANRFKTFKPHFRVIYNGVDFNRFENKRTDKGSLKKELGLSKFNYIVGMFASLSHYKDHETLLEAIPLIRSDVFNVGFLFVGDGETRQFLERKAKLLGLQDVVVFAGFRSDVDSLYSLLDVCVLLTNSRIILDGIPNVLIEAMASGVPVVASSGGGTNEIVRDNNTGILVPPLQHLGVAEAIIRLLSDSVMVAKIVDNARVFVRKSFSLERYVQEYEVLYDVLLENVDVVDERKA